MENELMYLFDKMMTIEEKIELLEDLGLDSEVAKLEKEYELLKNIVNKIT